MATIIKPPSLEDDSFVDKAIATLSFCAWPRHDGQITNAVQILSRPLDVRSDESGNHPGETFVMLTLTREEVQAIHLELERDWGEIQRHAPTGAALASLDQYMGLCAAQEQTIERLRDRVAELEKLKPVFWYRKRSDGGYEGPIHDSQIESVRRESGAWIPLIARTNQPTEAGD